MRSTPTRRPLQAIAASPTMVGAITTLIVIVAVFLAYNANQGLPFVSVYRVSVEVPNASRLVENNEVRIGGTRVGVVESIEPVRADGGDGNGGDVDGEGEIAAKLNLKLDTEAEPLPKDSSFQVRYRSTFGLKYLDVNRGGGPPAPEGFEFIGTDDSDDPGDADSEILSIEEAEENPGAANGTFINQTEFDDIADTFDLRTRNAGRKTLKGFGNGFAGRGESLNRTIEELNPLIGNLEPVARALRAPEARLRRLFPELGDAGRIVAPVATEQAELFGNAADAFAALAEDPDALRAAISEGVPTLETGIETLPRQRTFLAEVTELSVRLRPGVRQLRLALPDLNAAIGEGTSVLARTPRTAGQLQGVLSELEGVVEQPTTLLSLERLEGTFDEALPTAEFVVPSQTVCNYWTYWAAFIPNALSERDQVGYNLRQAIVAPPLGDITLELIPGVPITIPGQVQTPYAGYSGLPANGRAGGLDPQPGRFKPFELPIFHPPVLGPTGQDGSDCQLGQIGYPLGDARLPGQPASNPAVTATDLPGDRGPTTVFFEQDGTRKLKDTRVEARQP